MTTFYRTPDVVVDAHEWHVIVWRKGGHVLVSHRWRPVAVKTHKWLSIASWKGPKPLGLWRFFAPYKRHIQHAQGCDARRREAIAALAVRRAPATGAMAQNAGRLRQDLAA